VISWLLSPLAGRVPVVGVFRYITFRAAIASLLALILSVALGPALIRWLRIRQIGQAIREEGPKAHQAKAGTPTMGGVLIILAVALPTLLFADLSSRYVWVALAAMLLATGIGVGDDWRKVSRRENRGLSGRQKLFLQTLVGFGVALASVTLFPGRPDPTHLSFPFFKNFHPDISMAGYLIFATIVVVGASNAVNLTDGLDGLAIGSTLIAAATFALLAYIAGNVRAASYLLVPYVPGTGELSVFLASLVGASLGFLWFNAHPAEVFMGDTGSLALGAALGAVAILIKQEILLVFVGGLFVVEALSVIIQVVSFRLTGKRVFRMAPLHHHFELLGWAESKVIIRFWIVAIVFALFSLSTLKLR
jgi:phospho-N-acetylmuramoyl-pentapeptide-transferase